MASACKVYNWTLTVEDVSDFPVVVIGFKCSDLYYKSRFNVDRRVFFNMVPADVSMEKRDELVYEARKMFDALPQTPSPLVPVVEDTSYLIKKYL